MASMDFANHFIERYLSKLGECRVQSQFGTKALFIDDFVVGHLESKRLYVRQCEENRELLLAFSGEQYKYQKGVSKQHLSAALKKNAHVVHTHYFLVPESYWGSSSFEIIVKAALEDAKQRKLDQSGKQVYRKLIGGKISNIRDAYNLTKTHESQFRRSGIQSFEQLVRMGSIEAYKALCEARHTDPYPINRKLLWQLEGAIQNVHWCVLSKETKERLLNGF